MYGLPSVFIPYYQNTNTLWFTGKWGGGRDVVPRVTKSLIFRDLDDILKIPFSFSIA